MSKLVKIFAALALIAGVVAITPGTAFAQRHHGGGHHGGGGHHFGGGGGWRGGGGFGFGWGYPYYYGGGPYYGAPDCGWVRVRVWRNGHWVLRRAWRCW
jgi:hypothetical protein